MGGVQALPPQDGAFLAVGGVLVLGDDRQFVLRAEHSSRRSWCRVGRRGRGVGLVIGWGGHVHKDLRSRPWPGAPVLTRGVSTQSGKEGKSSHTSTSSLANQDFAYRFSGWWMKLRRMSGTDKSVVSRRMSLAPYYGSPRPTLRPSTAGP